MVFASLSKSVTTPTVSINYYIISIYNYTALRNKVHNDTSLLIDMVTLLVVTHDFTSSTQSNE